MRDYEPLDLAPLCNAGPAELGHGPAIQPGAQTIHGIPFLIGSRERQVILLGGDFLAERRIPIGTTARSLVFAHRLLESSILDGDFVGRLCATYVVRYEDGEEIELPIRERFEIGIVPAPWGQTAFLAWTDAGDRLRPRHAGRWDDAARRLTEVSGPYPDALYAWPWRNPRAEVSIDSVILRPAGLRMVLAALTLGHLDEPVFNRAGTRPVKIVLPETEDASAAFAIEVDVDRGAATYPYPLPATSAAEFLDQPFKGWGDAPNAQASPAYVEVAATPSATVTVRNGDDELGSFRWGDLEQAGELDASPRLRLTLVDEGRNWVRTTVVDDATGDPIPCRVHFRSPEGVPFQPHGHHNHVNSDLDSWHMDVGGDLKLGQTVYAYIDGHCEGWLPRGEVLVDVARGYEYEPLRERVTIARGQQTLELRLRRLTDLRKERYFSGDTHVHFLSTQGAHLEAAGEGLNIVNLLLSQWGHLFTNTEEFTGRPSVAPDGETIVYASQENRQHILGHLTLLGLKEPVMPWCSGGPGEAELAGTLETTLSHWADRCHEQGGTVIIPHLPTPNCEPAALIATGRADAVEWIEQDAFEHREYYRYLNMGYRLPLAGGTDKMSSDVAVGTYRTYVHIPDDEPVTYESWCRGLRSGNTFLSGGPLLRLTVDGSPIGSTIVLPGNGGTVEVEASAESVVPFGSLELVVNGEVVARTGSGCLERRLSLREHITVDRHSWIAVRCGGPQYFDSIRHHDCWSRGIMAHTSPVYVGVGGEWRMFDPGVASYLVTLLSGGIDYINQRSVQRPAGSVTHHHGRDDHLEYLAEPFHEAISAIHAKMHECGIAH
jgi:hypothetical protein